MATCSQWSLLIGTCNSACLTEDSHRCWMLLCHIRSISNILLYSCSDLRESIAKVLTLKYDRHLFLWVDLFTWVLQVTCSVWITVFNFWNYRFSCNLVRLFMTLVLFVLQLIVCIEHVFNPSEFCLPYSVFHMHCFCIDLAHFINKLHSRNSCVILVDKLSLVSIVVEVIIFSTSCLLSSNKVC